MCGIPRHKDLRCYKCFNRDYLGIDNDGSNIERQSAMEMAYSQGTVGGRKQQPVDPSWYTKSGATHHITNELDMLTMRKTYHGTDQVHSTNALGMRIPNIGHALLLTPPSRPLNLNCVLHFSKATGSIFSMSELSHYNNMFIKLHPYDLLVKDRDRSEPILRGCCHGGLYEIKALDIKQALSTIEVSHDMWHNCVGHPA
jgi:hypothetical protein